MEIGAWWALGLEGVVGSLQGGRGSSLCRADARWRLEGRANASTTNDGVRGGESEGHLGIVIDQSTSHRFGTEVATTLQEDCETLLLGLEEDLKDLNVHVGGLGFLCGLQSQQNDQLKN